MKGSHRPNIEAFHSYSLKWLGSPSPSRTVIGILDADYQTWYRTELENSEIKHNIFIDLKNLM